MAIATAIGAGLTAAAGIGQMVAGGIQSKRGRKDLKELEANRPTYERPDEVDEAGRIVRLRASNPFLPGQNLMEQEIKGNTANTVQNIQDMGGVSDLYMAQTSQNKAMNDIGIQSAQNTINNELQLLKQLETEADYTDKEFDFNVNIPFQEKRQDALSRIGAGMENLFGGFGTLAKGATGFMGMPKAEDGFAGGDGTSVAGVSNQVGDSIDVNPTSQMNSFFPKQSRLSQIRQDAGYMNPIGINLPNRNQPNLVADTRSMYGYNNPVGINLPQKPSFPSRLDRINNLYNF